MVRHSWKSGGAFPRRRFCHAAFQNWGSTSSIWRFAWKCSAMRLKASGLWETRVDLNVTIPHKVAAIPFLDEVEPTAKHIRAINTIVVEDGRLRATTRTRPVPYAP